MLLELLPERLQQSAETAEFQNALEKEIQRAIAAYDQFLLQLFILSADEEIFLWEKMYGLMPIGDIRFRRSRVMSKMRGTGTTTKEMLQNVCKSFYKGEIEIVEHYSEYSFDIIFVNQIGMPQNLTGMMAAVEEIKPAHLSCQYVFFYRTYESLKKKKHKELTPYTHRGIREGGEI